MNTQSEALEMSCSSSNESVNMFAETEETSNRPLIFSWHPENSLDLDLENTTSIENFLLQNLPSTPPSKIITHEPTSSTPDSWLTGGVFGSRSALLVFKSSALAHHSESMINEKPGHKLHVTYKVLQAETKLLAKLLECHGVTEVAANSSDFNILWTGSHPKPGMLRSLAPHQRVNHFPRSFELTRKDRLYKNIERMQHAKGAKHFDFIPQTFVMPTEYGELCSTHHRIKGPWIVKPVASSRGRGIFIVETPSQVPLEEPVVVAKYISKPLLVAGHKCDLRLYVAVTSVDPLLIYIYEEGLVRFATVKYDASHKQLWNPCMHLCNYSINKYHSDYVKSEDPSAENVGHKWTLSALLRHLKSEGKNTTLLMGQIEDLIIKAILSSAHSIIVACRMFVPNPGNCFELYGFDILIDENLKPWLLEVNLSPSLGCDTPLDVRLKSAMLADLLTLIGIPAVDPILRPIVINSASNNVCPPLKNQPTTISTKNSGNNLKNKSGSSSNCRSTYSADGLSNTLPKKSNTNSRTTLNSSPLLSGEESRVLKQAKAQFERRGGFVLIFPAVDSWMKYSQYLDPITGIPTSGNTTLTNFSLITTHTHNLNLMIAQNMFPDENLLPAINIHTAAMNDCKNIARLSHRFSSLDRASTATSSSSNNNNNNNGNSRRDLLVHEDVKSGVKNSQAAASGIRQNRYERMLSQGHRAALITPKKCANKRLNRSQELRREIMEMLKNDKKLSQCETRRTFSHYLASVLTRISANPDDQNDHVNIVLKFLQRASSYLRTPFSVKVPSQELDVKDRTAVIAKQLGDFLYLYNRETDLFVDKTEKPSQIPNNVFSEFLENARECDLEEILIHQTTLTLPATHGTNNSFQGILKCIPNVPKMQGLKPPYKSTSSTTSTATTNSSNTTTLSKRKSLKSTA